MVVDNVFSSSLGEAYFGTAIHLEHIQCGIKTPLQLCHSSVRGVFE